jgi:tRNA(Ile)-lysidine synthase
VQLQLIDLGLNPTYDLVEHLRKKEGKTISVAKVQPREGQLERSVSIWRDASGMVQVRHASRLRFNTDKSNINLRSTRQVVFGGARISWELASQKPANQLPATLPGEEVFDADSVGADIVLRHWQPGDRFQPIGMRHAVKLQDLFINQKVSRDSRHERIVATTALGELFWVEGIRIAERFKLAKATIRRLHWRWHRL